MRVSPALPVLGLLLLGLGHGLAAQTVEIYPGQREGADQAPATELILTGLMDKLFTAGLIATNGRPVQVAEATFGDPALGLAEAREGRADYLVVLYVAYGSPFKVPGGFWPSELRYRVVDTASGRVLASGRLEPPPPDILDLPKFETGLKALGGQVAIAVTPSLHGRIGRLPPPPSSPPGQGV